MENHPLEELVPLQAVLEVIGDICPNCQVLVRGRLAQNLEARKEESVGFSRPRALSLTDIVGQVFQETKISLDQMQSIHSYKTISDARRLVVTRARAAGFTLVEIGDLLKRHHTTIIYLLKTKTT
jgi:chromosomal replication initiation ATPase DnaA